MDRPVNNRLARRRCLQGKEPLLAPLLLVAGVVAGVVVAVAGEALTQLLLHRLRDGPMANPLWGL